MWKKCVKKILSNTTVFNIKINTYFLNPKWAYYNDFGMDHVTLKTGVMAAEKLALPSNILWIEIFFFLNVF